MLRKVLQPFYTAFAAITFVVSVLLVFPAFVVVSVGNNVTARKIIYVLIKCWAKIWLWIIGMPVSLINKPRSGGRYVVVANHISYLDTIVIFTAVPGYFRPLGKKEISVIPIVGFIYKQIVIMVNRSNLHSRARSMRLMWRALNREGSIAIFPEGTFNETGGPLKEFYDGAFRLAINTQTPILPMIFPDTVHRWHYGGWWKLWPGKNRVIYLQPIEVEGMTMENLHELKQKVYDAMEDEIKKHMHENIIASHDLA